MKLQNLFLMTFVAAALFAASPAMAETLFYDDFEDGLTTNGHIADNVSVDPGSWTVDGNVYDFIFTDIFGFGYADGGTTGRYGSTLKGTKTGEGYVSTNLIAGGFTPVSDPTTLVRFEGDIAIDNPSTSDGNGLDFTIMDGTTASDPLVFAPGNGIATDTWYHLALEYYPGASTCDYSINGSPAQSVPLSAPVSSISGIRIRGLSSTTWVGIDNVEITAIAAEVPEPSTVALLICGLFGLLCVWKKRK